MTGSYKLVGYLSPFSWAVFAKRLLQRFYIQRTWTSMARKTQLTPSTTSSQVHATCCCPLSPLPSHTVPPSRRGSSNGRCIAAHLQPVHKAMGDEGFEAEAKSLCGWSSWKSVGPRFELGRRSFSPVAFLQSSICEEVFTTYLPIYFDSREMTSAWAMNSILSSKVHDSLLWPSYDWTYIVLT